jgi:hypothetical protein
LPSSPCPPLVLDAPAADVRAAVVRVEDGTEGVGQVQQVAVVDASVVQLAGEVVQ